MNLKILSYILSAIIAINTTAQAVSLQNTLSPLVSENELQNCHWCPQCYNDPKEQSIALQGLIALSADKGEKIREDEKGIEANLRYGAYMAKGRAQEARNKAEKAKTSDQIAQLNALAMAEDEKAKVYSDTANKETAERLAKTAAVEWAEIEAKLKRRALFEEQERAKAIRAVASELEADAAKIREELKERKAPGERKRAVAQEEITAAPQSKRIKS